MSSDERSICFIKNNCISSQAILRNVMNTLKHFSKYFSDIFLMLYDIRITLFCIVISWYCFSAFISLGFLTKPSFK